MVSVRDMPYTVTNSFKRGLMMKTYSRPVRRVLDEEARPASKKRRLFNYPNHDTTQYGSDHNLECAIRESSAAVLSSPSRHTSTAFSEDLHDDDLSTPPSSPPPALQLTPPPPSSRKPTFSFLKRKRPANEPATPLSEVNSNSLRASMDPPPAKKVQTHHHHQPVTPSPQPQQQQQKQQQQQQQQQLPPQKQQQPQPVLRQMKLDLGGELRKTCGACGMEYVPSSPEDVALHKKFHEMNANGIDMGKAFVKANASRWVYEAARFDSGYVVIVDRKSSPTAKNQAKRVLEVVNNELSAPEIDDTLLWSKIETPKRFRKNGSTEETDRFKVFLHMTDSKCVGLCLTERIWESHPVQHARLNGDATSPNNSSSITASEEITPAIVGVSRVWTSASSRRKGIAMDLLDCVVSNYIYGMEIPKAQIAFSQPTESGCKLLEAFFGTDEPWHVYKEKY
ncbi:N-acetyltransferase O1 (Establishment of cohesion protein 1) [Myotisia sp. PD_48]|nr:N-acetyltransferase O1 (Establishment of cohesion protein 1) [Myotisia sp. PD_48]